MQGSSFQLDKSAIAAGRVVLYRSCPACSMFPLKPVDGYVKGINLTPEKPADQTKWLLEAKIILGDASGETSYRDTLYVNSTSIQTLFIIDLLMGKTITSTKSFTLSILRFCFTL